MAGDSKIWIMALFFLISFVYKAIKKKRKAEKEAREVELSGESSAGTEESSWGINDLISQFEDEYGVKKNPEIVVDTIPQEEVSYSNNSVNSNVKLEVSPTNVNYSEERASHQALASNVKEEPKKKSESAYDQKIAEEMEDLDLKTMVIHNVILQRPEY